jgi:hypothetical protein
MLQFAGAVTAGQVKCALLVVMFEAVGVPGAPGNVVQALHVPRGIHGCPLPAGPLCVAGSSPMVQKAFW